MSQSSCKLVSIDQCVWDGDEWLEVKTCLSKIDRYNGLEHLFRMILKIRNATWQDSIEELHSIRENGEKHHKISEIYRSLLREFEREDSFDTLR